MRSASLIGHVSRLITSVSAILIYRVLRFLPKRLLKISHAIIHLSIMILFSIGLAAVFDFHNWKKIPNLYSLHSWLGLGMVVMFIGQVSRELTLPCSSHIAWVRRFSVRIWSARLLTALRVFETQSRIDAIPSRSWNPNFRWRWSHCHDGRN